MTNTNTVTPTTITQTNTQIQIQIQGTPGSQWAKRQSRGKRSQVDWVHYELAPTTTTRASGSAQKCKTFSRRPPLHNLGASHGKQDLEPNLVSVSRERPPPRWGGNYIWQAVIVICKLIWNNSTWVHQTHILSYFNFTIHAKPADLFFTWDKVSNEWNWIIWTADCASLNLMLFMKLGH